MVDLETLGTCSGCVILSIGAVFFSRLSNVGDSDALGPEFYTVVSKKSCESAGLYVDPSTEAWWAKQAPDAQKVLADASSDESPALDVALKNFSDFLGSYGPDVHVWGNGSDFDNALLLYAYRSVGESQGWRYHRSRCYRTLVDLAGVKVPKRVQQGTFHNALDDAKSQALHAVQCFAALKNA